MSKQTKKAGVKPAKDKVGVIRIPSNGLDSQKDGWVEMAAYLKIGHLPYVDALDLTAIKEDGLPEEKTKSQETTFALLGAFVVDWNWKGFDGKPYPKPMGNPGIFREIRREEYTWIWNRLWESVGGNIGIPKANDTR